MPGKNPAVEVHDVNAGPFKVGSDARRARSAATVDQQLAISGHLGHPSRQAGVCDVDRTWKMSTGEFRSPAYIEHVDFLTLDQSDRVVHADLSEYNIMVHEDKPIIFDVSQAMLTSHQLAETLLVRDIGNVNRFFRRLDVNIRDPEELKEWITGGTEDIY